MSHAVKVRGRLSDPRHVELDQPVNGLAGPVDVILEEVGQSPAVAARGIIGLCADLGSAPSAEEIDEARRQTWAGFPRDDV